MDIDVKAISTKQIYLNRKEKEKEKNTTQSRSVYLDRLTFIRIFLLDHFYPGRIGTVVNDRLRRKTEIYGGRTRTPYTSTVYDGKRSETDSVYGDRVKIRSD